MKYSVLLPISVALTLAQSSLVAAHRIQESYLHLLPRYTSTSPHALYPRGAARFREIAAQGTSSRGTSSSEGNAETSPGGGLRSSDNRAALPLPLKASKQLSARLGVAHGGVNKKQSEPRVMKPSGGPIPISPFDNDSQSPKKSSSSNSNPFKEASMSRDDSILSTKTSPRSKTSGGGRPMARLRRQRPLPGASTMLAVDMSMLSTDDR